MILTLPSNLSTHIVTPAENKKVEKASQHFHQVNNQPVTMNPLPVHNHETTFILLHENSSAHLTPFEWQCHVGSIILLMTFLKRVCVDWALLIEKTHDCLMLGRQSAFEPTSERWEEEGLSQNWRWQPWKFAIKISDGFLTCIINISIEWSKVSVICGQIEMFTRLSEIGSFLYLTILFSLCCIATCLLS